MANLKRMSNPELFKAFINDPDRKSVLRISYELFFLLIKFREIPVHYFSRYLFKKKTRNYKDFVPNKLAGKISIRINDHKSKEVLDNKLFFNLFYSQFDIKVPNILMYNHNNMFVIDNKPIEVQNVEDFAEILTDLFEKNSSVESVMIKKTFASSSGKKIFKLLGSQVASEPKVMKFIYSEVIQSGFLFQETIKQHPLLDRINASCLNTIRIDTFIDSDGKVEIASAYLRMSICNSHIDNISSGGCQVGIVLGTGRLKKYGYALIQTMGVTILTEHPITKTTFEDYPLPYFGEVKELVLKTARLMPGLRLIGWDVAVGESGPILIEGNSDYDLSGNDLADNGYLSNKVFKKVLAELDL